MKNELWRFQMKENYDHVCCQNCRIYPGNDDYGAQQFKADQWKQLYNVNIFSFLTQKANMQLKPRLSFCEKVGGAQERLARTY